MEKCKFSPVAAAYGNLTQEFIDMRNERDRYRDALKELMSMSSFFIRIYGDDGTRSKLKHAQSILNSSEGK